MRTILSIIGARPQFIKHAMVQRQLGKHFRALTLHTGQHYDANMSRVFFEELHIPAPDFQLNAQSAGTHSEQTGSMMAGIETVCSELKPDAVLVYGDTNTTLSGALVAAKRNIPLFHVEAGIRGYNRALPEEVNRIIADTFSSLLFCPTSESVDNLRREAIDHQGVHLTGDVMCDLLEEMRGMLKPAVRGPYYYATIHRPYNTDNSVRLRRIIAALNGLAHPVRFPLHPRTARRMADAGMRTGDYRNIRFSEPVSYLTSLSLQAGAECIITDSSGVQKEAYMLHRKCLTLRTETEWNDTLKHGWNTLLFDEVEHMAELVSRMPGRYEEGMFGDGQAAERIAGIVRRYLG